MSRQWCARRSGSSASKPVRVDALVDLHRAPALAQLDRGGGPVQLHVGRAEAGPVVVVVAAEPHGRLLGAAEQVAHGGAVADPGGGHRALQQQHAVDATAAPGWPSPPSPGASRLAMLTLISSAGRDRPSASSALATRVVAMPASSWSPARWDTAIDRSAASQASSCSPSLRSADEAIW